jgi:hypothetical protein
MFILKPLFIVQKALKGMDKSNRVLITAEKAEGCRKTVPFFISSAFSALSVV